MIKRFTEYKTNEEFEIDRNKTYNGIEGGLADDMTIQDIADTHSVEVEEIETQMQLGIEIELEHTIRGKKDDYEASELDIELATEIAMDHLMEDPKYYDKLQQMEDEPIQTTAKPDDAVDNDTEVDTEVDVEDTKSELGELAESNIKRFKSFKY